MVAVARAHKPTSIAVTRAPDPHAQVGLDPHRVRARQAKVANFRQLLERKGLTMTLLAHKVGLNHSYISRIISGHRTPSLRTAVELAEALGLTLQEMADILL